MTQFVSLDTAVQIARDLCTNALWSGTECTWVGTNAGAWAAGEGYTLSPVGVTLYDGNAGIGLFLAQCWALVGESRMKDTARGAFMHCLASLERQPLAAFGLYDGLTGIALALARSARALGADDLSEAADALGRLVVDSGRLPPKGYDVISGSAGEILGLVELFGCSSEVLTAAEACITTWNAATARGAAAEPSSAPLPFDQRLFAGFAHGASGVAVALLEIASRMDSPDFFEIGSSAVQLEATLYSSTFLNWADSRRPLSVDRYGTIAWCHGAAGIGMARLRALQLYPDQIAWQREAAAAVAASRARLTHLLTYPESDATPCHGVAGLLEILLLAAQLDPLLAEQREVADAWECINAELGDYRNWEHGLPVAGRTPSLMQGSAGIGYSLLRSAYPESVPSVLMPTWSLASPKPDEPEPNRGVASRPGEAH